MWVRDGKAALARFECDPTIQMVMSDIVMPGGMSGLELARAMREHHPGLPVLLTSGYSQYRPQSEKDGFILIEKPYRRDVLAASIRRAIERGTRKRAELEPSVKRNARSHAG